MVGYRISQYLRGTTRKKHDIDSNILEEKDV